MKREPNHTTPQLSLTTPGQLVAFTCVVVAATTLSDNAVLQFFFGFVVGFAEALGHAF